MAVDMRPCSSSGRAGNEDCGASGADDVAELEADRSAEDEFEAASKRFIMGIRCFCYEGTCNEGYDQEMLNTISPVIITPTRGQPPVRPMI